MEYFPHKSETCSPTNIYISHKEEWAYLGDLWRKQKGEHVCLWSFKVTNASGIAGHFMSSSAVIMMPVMG